MLRVDKWLWYARIFKARERAAAFVEAGHVRIAHPGSDSKRVLKVSQTVKPGDVLTLTLPGRVRVLRVEGLGHRRGPPAEARMLYAEFGH